MPPRDVFLVSLPRATPIANAVTSRQPTSDEKGIPDDVTYLEETGPLASPYRVTKSVLMEKGDGSETLYDDRGYGGMGQYEEVRDLSWKERLIPTRLKEVQEACSTDRENETERIGLWLASQYYFRQAVYFISLGFVLWIPGLLALTIAGSNAANTYSRMQLFGVSSFWWSVWLSTSWAGLWVCYCIATVIPFLSRKWVGVLSIALKRYITYAEATRCYVTFALWTFVVWIIYVSTVFEHFPGYSSIDTSQIDPLISSNSTNTSTISTRIPSAAPILMPRASEIASNPIRAAELDSNAAWLTSISRLLFGLIICSVILLAEKVLMQTIAFSFHQTTYQDRNKQSNDHISILIKLVSSLPRGSYIDGSPYCMHLAATQLKSIKKEAGAASIASRARKFKAAAATRIRPKALDPCDKISLAMHHPPFSVAAYVEAAIEDEAMSQEMASQIFAAFAHSNPSTEVKEVIESDIRPFYESDAEARHAFTTFDRDNNDSCTWQEFQASIADMHKERMCLLASLHDVDSAVLKLNNIFMSLYLFVFCVIIAALMSSKFSTLVASLGTIMLGLSWLVGSAAQESLNSMIWVFGKHPIDVGDAIEIPGLLSSSTSNVTPENIFFVEEIQLLSTVLKTTTGRMILVSNFQLAQRPIVNIRRSGPMVELFRIDIEYATPLDKVDQLRKKMITWIESRGRDFLNGLSILISPLQDQSAISLKLDIRYKSNWQDGPLKAMRRNTWMAALKGLMEDLQMKGPPLRYDER